MSIASFERFARLVRCDPALERELWEATDDASFTALAIARARERGIELDRAAVASASANGLARWYAAVDG